MANSGGKSKRFLAGRRKMLCHRHGGVFGSALFSDRPLTLNIILLNLLVQRRAVNRNRHEPRRRRRAGGRFIARLPRSGLGHNAGRDAFGAKICHRHYATTFQAAVAYSRTSRSSRFADLSSATSRSSSICSPNQNCAGVLKYRARRSAVSADMPRLPNTISLKNSVCIKKILY
ncbi:MAG: hypothetical protein ILNGONEN_02154 [Syntrophorhabdaceae bacterium]|nr:hypothetical protein [Syntrophorhabdaceae bacterium]